MKIAYFANPMSTHDCKWINHFANFNEVYLICIPNTNRTYPLVSPNVKIVDDILPLSYPYLNFIKRYFIIYKLNNLFKKVNIELIHSMYAVPNAIWVNHTRFPRHIITTRGSDVLVDLNKVFQQPQNRRQGFFYAYFIKQLQNAFNRANYITSTSIKQQEVLKNVVENKSKLRLIRTGVNKDKLLEIYKEIPDKDKTIFTVFSPRSMRPLYNIEKILKGFSVFKNKYNVNCRLVLINDSCSSIYFEKIKQEIIVNKIVQHVQILPLSSLEEMCIQYKKSDVVLMLPASDGTPVSAIESMIALRPLIMNRGIDYDKDLFNDDTVWWSDPNAPEDIAEKIYEIYCSDREIISRKTEAAFEIASLKGDAKIEMTKVYNLYEEVLKSQPVAYKT